MTNPKPPLTTELVWSEGLRFAARPRPERDRRGWRRRRRPIADAARRVWPGRLHGRRRRCDSPERPSSVDRSASLDSAATAPPNPPRRFVRITLHFHVVGAVPKEAFERAIALSREKYCSVWHSMRQDIDVPHLVRHPPVTTAHAPSERKAYLDWLRGVGVLVMIQGHVVDSWTAVPDRTREAYHWITFVGGIGGAPVFLFLAGVALVLARRRAIRRGRTEARSRSAGADAWLADLRPGVPVSSAVVDHQRRFAGDAPQGRHSECHGVVDARGGSALERRRAVVARTLLFALVDGRRCDADAPCAHIGADRCHCPIRSSGICARRAAQPRSRCSRGLGSCWRAVPSGCGWTRKRTAKSGV